MEDLHSIHARLDALSHRIDDTSAVLREKTSWYDGHRLRADELRARYAYLRSRVDGDIAQVESDGRHVSQLETSVIEWIESLNLGVA